MHLASIYLPVTAFILLAILLKLYCKLSAGKDISYTCMIGKTVLITGANTGIGYYTALEMAKRGARVILACRNMEKAQLAKNKIIATTRNENIVVAIVDLSSFASVRRFAEQINETEDRLDVLINNAGAVYLGKEKTVDGFDQVMQINYFSPFLLTMLLLDLLKKSSPSRIINVSSIAAKAAIIDPKNLDSNKNDIQTYCNSKLCMMLFTKYLADNLLICSEVAVYSVHPGVTKTEKWNNVRAFKSLLKLLMWICFKTAEEGAQTQNYLATAINIEFFSGRHFSDCAACDYKKAEDEDLVKAVWTETKKLIERHGLSTENQ